MKPIVFFLFFAMVFSLSCTDKNRCIVVKNGLIIIKSQESMHFKTISIDNANKEIFNKRYFNDSVIGYKKEFNVIKLLDSLKFIKPNIFRFHIMVQKDFEIGDALLPFDFELTVRQLNDKDSLIFFHSRY